MELPITVISELEPIFAKYATAKKPRIPGSRAFARTEPHLKPKRKVSRVGKLGIIRLKGSDMEKLRHEAFERVGGICELKLDSDCWGRCAEYRGELAHIRTKRNNGDTLDNVQWACPSCHSRSHNCGGKPIKVTKREATKGNQ